MPSKVFIAPLLSAKTIQTNPCDYKGHAHTPPRGEACFKLRAKGSRRTDEVHGKFDRLSEVVGVGK